jgi:methionyl-tRNA formyltransferase
LLPGPFLFAPKHGAVNVHPSLLPLHRGASPVAGAILTGDLATGTTIMKMDEGLDTGDVLAMEEIPLSGTERSPGLTEALFALGAQMLNRTLPAYLAGEILPKPQVTERATVIKRFKKEDGQLDWSMSAVELERRVRALDPWPGTATTYHGERLEVLSATVLGPRGMAPGTVVVQGREVAVGTRDGMLVLHQVKPAGRKPMAAIDFLRGHPDFAGATLPS